MIGVLIAGPIVSKYFHKLSYEDIQKYPLSQRNKLIKNLIQDDSVPHTAKRWLKLALFLRITSTVLFYSLVLFLIILFLIHWIFGSRN